MIFFTVIFPTFQTCSMSPFRVVISLLEESHKHFEQSRKISCDLQPAPQPFCIILNIELDPRRPAELYLPLDDYHDDDFPFGHGICPSASLSTPSSSHLHCYYFSKPSTIYTATSTTSTSPTHYHSTFPPKTSQTHSSSIATTAVFLTQPQSASRQRQTIHGVQTRTYSFTYAHFPTSVFTTLPQVHSDSPTQEQYRPPKTAYTTNHNDFSHQFAQLTSTNITSSTESATFATCITSTTIQASTPPHGFTTLS